MRQRVISIFRPDVFPSGNPSADASPHTMSKTHLSRTLLSSASSPTSRSSIFRRSLSVYQGFVSRSGLARYIVYGSSFSLAAFDLAMS